MEFLFKIGLGISRSAFLDSQLPGGEGEVTAGNLGALGDFFVFVKAFDIQIEVRHARGIDELHRGVGGRGGLIRWRCGFLSFCDDVAKPEGE